jgi:hypothetical protein
VNSHEPYDDSSDDSSGDISGDISGGSFDDLEAELTALGSFLDPPAPPRPPADVAAAVRARLETPDPAHGPHPPAPGRRDDSRRPARRGRRARWKIVAAVVAVVIAITAATPQGRAAVVRILRFAGIEMRIEEGTPAPVRTPTSLPGEHTVSPGDLGGQVRFQVKIPAKLGTPQRTTVADRGRVVSMFWPDGIRLDQFEGGVDPIFFKKLGPPWPDYVQMSHAQGWWIPGEHPLGYIRRDDGTEVPLRQAAQSLVWQYGSRTFRLEGVTTKARAVEIAESVT